MTSFLEGCHSYFVPIRPTLIQGLLAIVAIVVGGFLWHWITTPLVVSVSGTGRVSVPAEKAIFTVTVSAVDADLTYAVSQVRQSTVTLRQLLENEGIIADWVSESQLQVTPAGALVAGATGNQAVITLTVETPYVDTVGELVVFLYQNGATIVSQPVVIAENQTELENQALQEALKEANDNARALGRSKWKFLRRPVSIAQASSGQSATATKTVSPALEAAGIVSANGTFEIVQAVNVVYELW